MEANASTRSAPASRTCSGGGIRSLSDLPPEIKSMIVDEIAEEGPDVEEIGPMRAISLVSREFAALAEPYLWKYVDLTTLHTSHLAYFLTHVLPHHVHHVKHLDIPPLDDKHKVADRGTDDCNAFSPRSIAVMQNPVFSSQLTRRNLLAAAVGGMTKLCGVRCDLHSLSDMFDELSKAAKGGRWTERGMPVRPPSVAGALAALGPRLVDLELIGDGKTGNEDDDDEVYYGEATIEWTEGGLASFLSNFPSLSRLALAVSTSKTGRECLISTLTSFHHLRTLQLTFSYLLTEAFATAPWLCPLESLSLTETQMPIPILFNLLANFSATLETFTLKQGLSEEFLFVVQQTAPPPCRPFPLPHLHTLDISITSDGAILLPAFASCPLKNITVHDTSIESDTALGEFLHSHKRTLKRVTMYDEEDSMVEPWVWEPRSPNWERCSVHGIGCEVIDTSSQVAGGDESEFGGEGKSENGSEEGREVEQDDETMSHV